MKEQNKIYECKNCVNSIRKDKNLHCSTKIVQRDKPLNDKTLVGVAVNCSNFLGFEK